MDNYSQDLTTHMLGGLALKNAGLREFKSVEEVQQWVDEHGGAEAGEGSLRNAAAKASGGYPRVLALVHEWLDRQDRMRADARAAQALELERQAVRAAERSAVASERAARYAMWSALVSLASAIGVCRSVLAHARAELSGPTASTSMCQGCETSLGKRAKIPLRVPYPMQVGRSTLRMLPIHLGRRNCAS